MGGALTSPALGLTQLAYTQIVLVIIWVVTNYLPPGVCLFGAKS